MPPSPALRCSPGRELRTEHNHKRGRSFESTVPMKTKDEDLTLFADMESRESDNFLLQTADDLNDSIARLRYYSDFKLSVNIHTRGESSDLLNVDGEKNDYDWLLTPPDTPLFRSLDDEDAQLVNPAPRGRQHSQPISIRSSASEMTQRTSRSSYSPQRLSPSPRSTTGVPQPKVTPSSAPHSSPTPLRPTTPSRRPSTPPSKPSATTPRSSTPTLRRMSTGSSGQASSPVRRGISPVRPSRGNSASPKLRGWLTNPPGFSSDSPANLCTSLAELPSSNSKVMSPASRNGRQSMSPTAPRNRRQSMSPVASRSTTSLHSHERDRFSTYSKGSVASSGDDDVDSLYSLGIETSSSPTSGKNGIIGNSRAIPFSKKPVRTPSASSIPKRSFDSALRQVDHHKTPQNMFRPLLSSVPTTTFYTGKANSVHRPLFSRNSSVTTSSNASSELGVIVANDFVESGDHDQSHLANEWEKPQDFDTQEEIFIFDKMDEISENGHSVGGVTDKVDLEELEKSAANFRDPGWVAPAPDGSYLASIPSEVDCLEMLKTCFKCGKQFRIMDAESITDVCQECIDDGLVSSEAASQTAFLVAQNEYPQSVRHTQIDRLSEEMRPAMEISELSGLHENDVDRDPDFVPSSFLCGMEVDPTEEGYSGQQPKSCQEGKAVQSESKFQEPQYATHPSPRASTLDGTGISVLLQRSSSSKWPVVQGRSFLASSIMCSEPSYTRDNVNVLRRSFSRDSASPSSSVDLASSRQSEFRVQRQLSSRKTEIEHMRNDGNEKAQISESLNSGLSSEQTFNRSVDAVDFEPLGKKETYNHVHNNSVENMRSSSTKSMGVAQAIVEGDLFGCTDSCAPVDSLYDTETSLAGASEELENDGSTRDPGVEHGKPEISCIGEEDMLNHSVCGNEMCDVATESSSLVTPPSQISLEGVQDLPSDVTASSDPHNIYVSHERSGPALLEKDSPVSAMESNTVDQHHGKPMITVEGPRGHMSRSLTLEEATDTILFCSSIIHDLAYKAATEVMEREESVTEPLRPTIPSNKNAVSNQKDSWTSSYKRTQKPQKTKQKRLETETNTAVTEFKDNTKIQNTMASNPDSVANKVDSAKPPKLESKCNCTIM